MSQQQQQQQQQAPLKVQKEKDRASDDCVVHVRNLDVLVTRINLYTFCTKTVGCKPESVRLLGMHAKRALYACQQDPVCMLKEPCMHAKRALYAC